MKRTIKTTALTTLFFMASSAYSNDSQLDNMTKQLSAQLKVQMKAQLEIMSDPKMIKAKAKYLKSFYEALIEEGFRKDQAMEIVIASASGKKS